MRHLRESTPRYAALRGVDFRSRIEFLREFESKLKTVFAHESGTQGYRLTKKPRVENLVI
jgi:hypothetical protein